MEYKGYEGLTQAQIKEKIIVEFFKEHRVGNDKWYSVSAFQSLITHKMRSSGQGYASDYHQDLKQWIFMELLKYTPEKFCTDFFKDGSFNSNRFYGTIDTILIRVGFTSIDRHTPRKGTLNDMAGFSSFNNMNVSINHATELNENGEGKLATEIEKALQDSKTTYDFFLTYLNEDESEIVEGWCNTIRKNHNMKQLKTKLNTYGAIAEGSIERPKRIEEKFIRLYRKLQQLKPLFTSDRVKQLFVEAMN